MSNTKPELVQAIPEPETIRERLDELRREARLLRGLLAVADTRKRLAKQKKQAEGAGDDA